VVHAVVMILMVDATKEQAVKPNLSRQQGSLRG
jgi:hypothetical protein